MNVENVEYALGKKGEIQEIISKEEFIRRFPNEHFEIKPEETFVDIFYIGSLASREQVKSGIEARVEGIYKSWGKFGPYGDVISITQPFSVLNDRIITILGRRAFPSPKLAVDCVIFVRDQAGNYFFVGIERSKEPGIGMAALIGGFIDVNGYDMETTLQAILREAGEEAGVLLSVTYDPFVVYGSSFTHNNVPILAQFSNDTCTTSVLIYVGDTITGDEEKQEHLGTRRVDRTFVYTCLIRLPGTQTAETAHEYFKAGSDAAKLAIIPFSPADQKSVGETAEKLAISHHKKMFLRAVDVIMK